MALGTMGWYDQERPRYEGGRFAHQHEKGRLWYAEADAGRKNHLRETLSGVKWLDHFVDCIGKSVGIWSIDEYRTFVENRRSIGQAFCTGMFHLQTYISFASMSIDELNQVMEFLGNIADSSRWAPGGNLTLAANTLMNEFQYRGIMDSDAGILLEYIKRKNREYRQEYATWAKNPPTDPSLRVSDAPTAWNDSGIRRVVSVQAMRASKNSDIVSQEVARLMNLVGQVDIQLEEPIEVSDIDGDIKGIEQDLSSFIQAHVATARWASEEGTSEHGSVPYMLSLARSSEEDTVHAIAYFLWLTRMILNSSHFEVLPRYMDDLRSVKTQEVTSRVAIFREVLLNILSDELHFAIREASRMCQPKVDVVENVDVVRTASMTVAGGEAEAMTQTEAATPTETVDMVMTFAQAFRALVEKDVSLHILFHPKNLVGYSELPEKYARYADDYNTGKKKVTNREVPAIPLPPTFATLCAKCEVRLSKDMKRVAAELLGEEYLNPDLFAPSDELADVPALDRLAKKFDVSRAKGIGVGRTGSIKRPLEKSDPKKNGRKPFDIITPIEVDETPIVDLLTSLLLDVHGLSANWNTIQNPASWALKNSLVQKVRVIAERIGSADELSYNEKVKAAASIRRALIAVFLPDQASSGSTRLNFWAFGFPEIQSVVELLQSNVMESLPKEAPSSMDGEVSDDTGKYDIRLYADGNPKRIADRLSVIASLKWLQKMTPREFILEHALTQFMVGDRSMSFVDILRESANSRKSAKSENKDAFWAKYRKLIMLLNSTLLSQGLPRIPFSPTGIIRSLSNGRETTLSYKVLLNRFGVTEDEMATASTEKLAQQTSSAKPNPATEKSVSVESARLSRSRFATEREFRHVFSMRINQGGGESITLRELVISNAEKKKGFWTPIFEAFAHLGDEFLAQYGVSLPVSQSMVGRAVNEGTTITREDFLDWVRSLPENESK